MSTVRASRLLDPFSNGLAIALVLLIAFAADSWGQSKGPPDTKQTQGTQQPAATDLRGTTQSPAIIKILPPDDAEDKAKQETKDRAAKDQLDWNTIKLGIAAVTVALLQFVAIGIQSWFLWRTVRVSETAAKVAQDSAEAVVSQLRAYIFAEHVKLIDFDSNPLVQIVFKNSGQSPAFDVDVWATVSVAAYPLEIKPERPDGLAQASRGSIGPGAEFHIAHRAQPPLANDDRINVVSGKAAIYIAGGITYKDAFKNNRFTNFCFMSGGDAGLHPKGAMAVYQNWNDAN
jgi:hypothetical protein